MKKIGQELKPKSGPESGLTTDRTADRNKLQLGLELTSGRERLAQRLIILAAFSTLALMNSGCEDKSQATLASAQSCLDGASTTSQANACAAKVATDYSADAYLIRCSANFIAQGVTGDRLALAYKQMDAGSSSSNKTTALMSYMLFNDSLTGNSSAETVFNCQSSGVASMYQLASAVGLATSVANVASSALGMPLAALLPDANGNVNTAALQLAVANLSAQVATWGPNNPQTIAAEATIGTAVTNSYSAFCTTNSTFSSADICNKINAAVGAGSSSQLIGASILQLLQAGH